MKRKIIDQIEQKLNETLSNLEDYSNILTESADLDEEATRDLDDFSQQSEDLDMKARVSQQAAKVAQDIHWLESNSAILQESIQPGALVETKEMWLFFGIALPNMEVDGKKLIGISEDAPAYAAMFGKKKNDTIQVGNKKLVVANIY